METILGQSCLDYVNLQIWPSLGKHCPRNKRFSYHYVNRKQFQEGILDKYAHQLFKSIRTAFYISIIYHYVSISYFFKYITLFHQFKLLMIFQEAKIARKSFV